MRRIQNGYCFYTLRDWLSAINQDIVKIEKAHIMDGAAINICDLLKLAECDCFPLLIICVRRHRTNYVMASQSLIHFFAFLNNEEPCVDGTDKIYFSQYSVERKSKILNAQASSAWAEGEDLSVFQ